MERKSYPTDLTDEQFALLEPILTASGCCFKPTKWTMEIILSAIMYVVRSCCAWRLLPHDFPPWKTVYDYFRILKKSGTICEIHHVLSKQVRIQAGRNPEPSAAIVDSQSAKTADKAEETGYDAGKKVKGRKRHILVDTLGMLIDVLVHPASIQDRDGAKTLLAQAIDRFPRLELIWADGAYAGTLVDWVKETCNCVLQIVKRPADAQGFQVLPHRWIVERTLAWLCRYRRLRADYEYLVETSTAMIKLAMINLMLQRLAPERQS